MLKFAYATCIALGFAVSMAHAASTDCQVTSSKMLDHLDQGDYAGATDDFNNRMKAGLGTDRLAKTWPALAQKFGARGAHEPAQLNQVNGYALVITPLHYGQSLVDARVVCDDDGKVAAFFFKPRR